MCGGAVRRRVREEPIAERSEPNWPKLAKAGEGIMCGGAVRRRVREEPIAERSEPSWPKLAKAGEGIRAVRPR